MTDRELLEVLERDGEEGARALCAQYAPLAASIARRDAASCPKVARRSPSAENISVNRFTAGCRRGYIFTQRICIPLARRDG